jgi:hypothetical protein
MIVKKLESPVFERRRRQGLPGKGVEAAPVNREKSFDQYLIEAFDGEVVKNGKNFSNGLSNLTRENIIRLSQI